MNATISTSFCTISIFLQIFLCHFDTYLGNSLCIFCQASLFLCPISLPLITPRHLLSLNSLSARSIRRAWEWCYEHQYINQQRMRARRAFCPKLKSAFCPRLSHVKGNNSDSGDKKEKEKRDCSLSAKWYSIVQENSPFSEAFLDHSKYNTIIY